MRADVERQVDAHVGVVHHHGEPDLGGNVAHASEQHLVLARQALERARARHVGGLVRGGGAGDLLVELLGLDARGHEGLGGTDGRAETALAAGILDVDAAVLDLDRVHGAHVLAGPAGTLLVLAGQAGNGVGARLLLVIRRVPRGRLARGHAHERIGDAAKRVLERAQALADIDDVIEEVVLLCHENPPRIRRCNLFILP